ncbi:MAG: hypothetical protein V4641_05760 [Pseudomonadota bacterium]
MRNYINRERDKLPVPFVHPPVRVRFDPYTQRLIFCNQVLRAKLENTELRLDGALSRNTL